MVYGGSAEKHPGDEPMVRDRTWNARCSPDATHATPSSSGTGGSQLGKLCPVTGSESCRIELGDPHAPATSESGGSQLGDSCCSSGAEPSFVELGWRPAGHPRGGTCGGVGRFAKEDCGQEPATTSSTPTIDPNRKRRR